MAIGLPHFIEKCAIYLATFYISEEGEEKNLDFVFFIEKEPVFPEFPPSEGLVRWQRIFHGPRAFSWFFSHFLIFKIIIGHVGLCMGPRRREWKNN